jgi:ABC-type glycerol-3-phosphate transport system permease component
MIERKRSLSGPAVQFALVIVIAISFYPLVLMAIDSFKSTEEISANAAGFAVRPTLENYRYLLVEYVNGIFVRGLVNSFFISVTYTALTLFVSALAAYAFSKCRFVGREVLFGILIGTMIFPYELTIPPLYIMFARIGWLNTYQVQILPGIANVFSLFMIRQFMNGVPDSLIESGRLEGASHLRVFSQIVAPVCTPVLTVVLILNFLSKFNDYLFPAIMVDKSEFKPIMTILPTITAINDSTSFAVPYSYLMAGCTVVTIPIVVIFLIFRKHVLDGVSMSIAVKG